MLDQYLSWKDHMQALEAKLVKNIGLLYRFKQYLSEFSLKKLYFCYIHSYLNYVKSHLQVPILQISKKVFCSIRGSKFWNDFPNKHEKEIQSYLLFPK